MSERETLHRGDVGSQFCLFPKIYNVQREREKGAKPIESNKEDKK